MSDKAHPREFTGRHMLYVMLAFFGVIIAVNVVMAVLATDSWTGLVVKNSYVASQEYNDTLRAAHEQDKLGWTSRIEHGNGELVVHIRDAAGKPVKGLNVEATIAVPAHENNDHKVVLQPVAQGAYRADSNLAPGQWQADVIATAPSGETYRQVFRFVVKSGT